MAESALGDRNRIVMIGLDAFDVDLLERWGAEGRLPFLNSLMESGAWARMDSTYGLFSDSPWPSLTAGVSPAKHAFYNYLQLRRGSTEIERIDARHCRHLPFWSQFGGTDRKVALLDVPKTFPIDGLNGVQVCAWGEHYPLLGKPASSPPDAARDLITRFGRYPHPHEIVIPRSRRQERRISRILQGNLARKLRATLYLLEMDAWDLLVSVFSEAHYGGHQFYHCMEESHWAHEPTAPEDIKQALPELAAALDRAVESIFDRCGPDTDFLVVSVHGITTNHSATYMLEDALERLGYFARAASVTAPAGPFESLLRRTNRLRELIPPRVRDYVNTHLVADSIHDRAYSTAFSTGTDWERTRAFLLPSDHFQAFISLNLKGREPHGTVEPGPEAEQLCVELSAELSQLVNPLTGRPAVAEVLRVADFYEGPNLHELPDLVVHWATDGPFEALAHPRFERIDGGDFALRRSMHSSDGFLIGTGPRLRTPARLNGVTTLDVAPTILTLMGLPVPSDLDGRVLSELLVDGVERETAPAEHSGLAVPGR